MTTPWPWPQPSSARGLAAFAQGSDGRREGRRRGGKFLGTGILKIATNTKGYNTDVPSGKLEGVLPVWFYMVYYGFMWFNMVSCGLISFIYYGLLSFTMV